MVPDPVFPGAARAGRAGSLDGVERVADRPVAERVEVHLDARLVEGGHVAGELAGVDEVQPGVPSRAAVVIEVGGEHRGGVVLHDAVEHHLHAGRPESPGRVVLAVVEQPLELLQALVPLPPLRPDDVRYQCAGRRRAQVRVRRVVNGGVAGPDDGVLPAGDAERQQVVLGGEQPPVLVLPGDLRQQPAHQPHRAFLQHADGLAGRVPLDPAVGRIRCAAVDARQLQGLAVGPRAVMVAVVQEHRPAGNHAVQRLPGGDPAGERGQSPPAADDPLQAGVRRRVARDDVQVGGGVAGLLQVAPEQLQAAGDRVRVRVDEAWQQRAAVEVDNVRRARFDVRPDGADLPVPDKDVSPLFQEAGAVEDRTAREKNAVADLAHLTSGCSACRA